MPQFLPKPHRIAIVIPADGQLIGVVGMAEAFVAANRIRAHFAKPHPYVIRWFGPSPVVRTASGLCVQTEPLHTLEPADTLVVGGRLADDPTHVHSEMVAAVRQVSDGCQRVVSVCTGAFILAAAGLLDGRRTTTHWLATDALAAHAPDAELVPDVLYTEDNGTFCSAGATAGIDLALHLIRRDCGPKLASAVAKSLVMFSNRPGGQSQFAAAAPLAPMSNDRIRGVVAQIVERPGADHSVPRLAKRAGMSPRTFARKFKQQTEQTPAAFVQTVRIEAARRALEHSEQTVDAIASDVGLGGAEALRRAFTKRVGVAPSAYRERFGQE